MASNVSRDLEGIGAQWPAYTAGSQKERPDLLQELADDLLEHQPRNLKRRNLKHTSYSCDAQGCSKSFTMKRDLNRHKTRYHSAPITRHDCDVEGCSKTFTRKDNLVRHKNEYHSAPIRRHDCDAQGCSKSFTTKRDLDRHKFACHSAPIRRHDCDVKGCSKSFNREDHLHRHKIACHSSHDFSDFIHTDLWPPNTFTMPPWTSINAESSPRALQLGAGLSYAHRSEPDLSGVRGSMQERVPYLPTPELRHPSSSLLQESLEAGVAPTDSGYASALHLVYQPEPPSAAVSKQSCKRAGANEEGESCEYTQTVYSEATTADPADSRAYVSELCLDIHDKIRRKTSLAPLPELFGTLPRLIKTLAVKIGQESDSQVNRDIMYFLHKSHREICGLLEELFLHGDEPDIKASDQGPEHMSIQEKMALWATVEDTEVNKGELFEGVRDEDEPEDDITAKVELANYHKVIRSSSAYQWFLASLYREFGLQRKHTMTETISSKILRCLPPEKISKSRTPQTHCVTFELGFPFAPQQGIKLAEMIAVTGFPDEAQVTTVEEYVRYMWPCDGLRLLRALQMVVDSSRDADGMSSFGITLQDKTDIEVELTSGTVLVTVEGSACSIAECGDQLAWLVTALSRRSDEGAVPRIPCCVKMGTSLLDSFRYPSGIVALSLLLLAGPSLPSDPWPCEKYWARALTKTVPGTVLGFPTIRRPEACSGVEFSCHVLFRMFGHPSTDPSIPGVRLTSSGVTLQLVHQARDVFYWHECDSFTSPRSCSLHPGNHHLAGLTMEHVSHSQLSTGRHIICDCYEVPIGTNRDVNNALASASSTSSTSGCFESDALSVSSDSEKAGFVDKESRAFQVFKRVFSRLVLLCQQETGQEQQPNTGKETQQIQSGPDHASYTVGGTRSSNGRKRLLPRDNEDGDGSGKPPPKKGKGRQPGCQARSRFLACPFWKLDPEKHWECFLKKNDTIGHLKQHLSRRHTPKFYCPRCYTIFPDHANYDTHVLGASCTRAPTAKLQGISHMQRDELSRKSKGSIQEQWYALWTILFPEHDPPTSIYIESTQSEDFCRIREFCQRDGVTILRHELESSGFFLRPEVSEEALRVAVQRAMESMFDTYWLRRSSAQAGTHVPSSSGENRSSSAGRSPQPETAVGSSTDSGVDILPISRPSRNRPGGIAASSTVHSDGPGELRYTGDDWLRDGMGFPTDQPGLSGGFGGTQLHTRNGLDPSLAASDPAFSDMQFPFGHVGLQHGMNGLETEPDVGNSQEWAGHPTAGPSAIGSIQDGSQGRLNQTHGFFSEMGGPLEHLDYEYLLRDVVDGWRGDSIDEEERR